MDFNDIRRQAESLIGKEGVRNFERKIKEHLSTDDTGTRQLVDVRNVRFTPEISIKEILASEIKATTESPTTGAIAAQENTLDQSSVNAAGAESSNSNHEASSIDENKAATEVTSTRAITTTRKGSKQSSGRTVPSQSSDIQTTESARSAAERLIAGAIRGEFIYATLGLVLGLASITGGIILGLHGVTGSTSWTALLLGFKSQINDAAPGVVLFIVGIFFVVATRPKVKLRDLK